MRQTLWRAFSSLENGTDIWKQVSLDLYKKVDFDWNKQEKGMTCLLLALNSHKPY